MPELSDLQIGQAIGLSDGRKAIVRFLGKPHFAAGDWVGVELDDASGKNDGAVQGQRYFDCQPGHGMFVKPAAVRVEEDEPTPKPAKAVNGRANGAATKGRPPSMGTVGALKKQSVLDPQANKRRSVNAGSPTPTARPAGLSRLTVRAEWEIIRNDGVEGTLTLISNSLQASLQQSSLARTLPQAIHQGQLLQLMVHESQCYRPPKALAHQWLLPPDLL